MIGQDGFQRLGEVVSWIGGLGFDPWLGCRASAALHGWCCLGGLLWGKEEREVCYGWGKRKGREKGKEKRKEREEGKGKEREKSKEREKKEGEEEQETRLEKEKRKRKTEEKRKRKEKRERKQKRREEKGNFLALTYQVLSSQ